jgi:tetratricopeptide (TPR) repeat protein
MKTIKFILFSLCICLIACEDTLDIPQQGVIPTTGTYENATDDKVNQLVASIYYSLHGDSFEELFGGAPSANALRNDLERMGGDIAQYYQYTESPDAATWSKIWSYYYKTIYHCNMIIEYLPGNKVASPGLVGRAIAEARAIRAISMMHLVQLYGEPPLADHLLTGVEGNTPAAESWSFVERELSECAESLPSKQGKDGQAAIGGRITREAAYAYLGKAYLWQKKYNDAASTLYSKVIATGLYELNPDFNELNRYTSDFCAENIWEYEISNAQGNESTQAGMYDIKIFGWSTSTLNIPDGFSLLDREECYGRGGYASESFGTFMQQHDTLPDGTKSGRYRATIADYEDLLDENLFSYNETDTKGIKMEVDNCEGYFRVKLHARTENVMGTGLNMFSHKNLCFMRYAEVLLNYAEAVAQGGAPGAMSGLDALNLVRRRAGLEDAPSLDMDHAAYGVKTERRAELYYEFSRFIDLVRWGEAATVLKDCGKYTCKFGGYKNGNHSTAQSKDEWYILKVPTVGEGFKAGKNELFPIPSIVLTYSPNLKQNPGW